MQLKSNQYVVFEDGHKEGYLEARWSERNQAFYSFIETEDGNKKIFSTDIREKEPRKKRTTTNNAPMREIHPCGETEKAYVVCTGTNGKVSRGNIKYYYEYVAKSICKVEDGKVFAPIWAIKW